MKSADRHNQRQWLRNREEGGGWGYRQTDRRTDIRQTERLTKSGWIDREEIEMGGRGGEGGGGGGGETEREREREKERERDREVNTKLTTRINYIVTQLQMKQLFTYRYHMIAYQCLKEIIVINTR